ncbi:hypothetical protein [Pedobacter immunditicola]|uniref:hypothetical protein n=1 Tax=Pedobacter immunditicola TaxID=3133440 RepID=UPI0030A3507C
MQFCGVKPHKGNIFLLAAKRFVTVLMVLLFAGAPVMDVLHHHEDSVSTQLQGENLTSHQVKCELCDHTTHHQPIPLLDMATMTLIHFEGNVQTINTQVNQKLLSLAGLGWSNKGPPSLL